MSLTFNFNAREVAPATGGADAVPEGWYTVVATKSDLALTKNGDGVMLKLTFEIVEGKYSGNVIFENMNVQNPNDEAVKIALRNLSALCHAINVMDPQLPGDSLLRIPLKIRVSLQQEVGFNPKNEIKAYRHVGYEPPVLPVKAQGVVLGTPPSLPNPATLPAQPWAPAQPMPAVQPAPALAQPVAPPPVAPPPVAAPVAQPVAAPVAQPVAAQPWQQPAQAWQQAASPVAQPVPQAQPVAAQPAPPPVAAQPWLQPPEPELTQAQLAAAAQPQAPAAAAFVAPWDVK